MVSKQKPIKNQERDPNTNVGTKDAKDLEKEINDIINTSKGIISCGHKLKKDKQSTNKDKTIIQGKPVQKNVPEITLEKVALDITNILKDLKDHLHSFQDTDSFSDLTPKLEESFLKTNQNTDNKLDFFKNCKSKPRNCANSSVRKSAAANNKPKTGSTNNNSSNMNKRPVTSPALSNNSSKYSRSSKNCCSPTVNNYTNKGTVSNHSHKATVSNHLNKGVYPKSAYNPLGVINAEVQKAIKANKTFTVKGAFPAVRRALLKRGWVEKLHISYRDRINTDLKKFQKYSLNELVQLLWNKEIAEDCKKLIKSKLLENNQVDFYWCYNYDAFKECPDKVKLTKINKFRKDVFSYASKLGLCAANKTAVWFKIPGIANFNHPRSYSLTKNGDTPEFIRDFNITAAISLLKWVVQNSKTGEYKVLSPSGKIPIEVFDFAINECYKFIKKAQHEDIDKEINEALDYEWNEFLQYFYKTVHIGNHFKKNNEVSETDMVRKANYILTNLRDYRPYIDMDGIMNIWILKPTRGSQGVGIHICRTLQNILNTIKTNPNRRYLIQKYIERPLLIYNTKFDIRQWFLITSALPLRIWMYKQSYLRFSSQTYNLRKLHESIHLTNNSVQCRYPKSTRDIALPSYNMWDSTQFKNYLSDIGYHNVFDKIIYPEMKQCITAAVIMYQDKLDPRKNCFELYGADFMLTEDFKPWLLEINANPALHSSTPVTAKMCPMVLEDVIKVVVDYEANKTADTGNFELIYQKDLSTDITGKNLILKGTPVTTDYFYTPSISEINTSEDENIVHSAFNIQKTNAIDYVRQIGMGMRKTLEDLLVILKKEKRNRHQRKNKGVATAVSHITETKESQTKYEKLSRIISETLLISHILEATESQKSGLENEKSERSYYSSQSSPIILNSKKSGSKHKYEIEETCT